MRNRVVALVAGALGLVPAGCGKDGGSGGDGLYGDGGPGDGGSGDDGGGDDGDGTRYDVAGGTGGGGDDGGGMPPSCEEAAMQMTNQGCEFWAVDLPQPWWGENGSAAPADGQFAIVVANASSNMPAQVDVFVGVQASPIDSASVPVDQVKVFQLPSMSINAQASSTDGVAYRIETDVPVTVYQFNTLEQASARYSADASLLFPTHVLKKDYTAFTGASLNAATYMIGAYVSVVGIEDGTTVDIYTDAMLAPGAPTSGVVIDAGEVLTTLAVASQPIPVHDDGNLSGARVAADKPVAVFSGNVGTNEPLDLPANAVCCADHIEQQMLPLEAWGDAYVVAPPVSPNGPGNVKAAYRVVGSVDATSFVYSPAAPPGAPSSVNAYETKYFVTDQAFTIAGTKPFGIAQFHVGAMATAAPTDLGANGDPAMVVLPAEDQYQDSYVFLVPPTYEVNWAAVMRPVGTTTELDGNAVAEPASPAGTLDGVDYEIVNVPITEGGHRITGDEPFALSVYGYADQASYAYPGGSGLAFISEPPPPPQG